MIFQPLGPGLPSLSAIGFGGMPLSIRDRPSEAQAISVIHAALDSGITLIDTADAYCLDEDEVGHNERLIAKALGGWPGDQAKVVLATKGGLTRPGGRWERNASPTHLRTACEQSLRALGVEQIQLYQLHAPDPAVPFADSVGTLRELQAEGKIKWIGLSNVTVAQIEQARRIVSVISVQNRLNPFFREAVADGVVQFCALEGLAFLAYSPVGGGRLNKKLPGHPALIPIARRHGCSEHAVVLAWVRAQGKTVIPIPGARTEEHVHDSASVADLTLSCGEIDAVDRAAFSRA